MTPFDIQLAELHARHTGVSATTLPSGTHLVIAPDVSLPDGWNRRSTTVRFLVQSSYPYAKPDCFWTDADLRLATGAMPTNTGQNPIPEMPGQPCLWFSWHLEQWNPARDTLSTWFSVVCRRFGHLS